MVLLHVPCFCLSFKCADSVLMNIEKALWPCIWTRLIYQWCVYWMSYWVFLSVAHFHAQLGPTEENNQVSSECVQTTHIWTLYVSTQSSIVKSQYFLHDEQNKFFYKVHSVHSHIITRSPEKKQLKWGPGRGLRRMKGKVGPSWVWFFARF